MMEKAIIFDNRYKNDSAATVTLNDIQKNQIAIFRDKLSKNEYKLEEVPCAICNDVAFEMLSEKDRYGLDCNVVICKKCGLVQTNPRMDQESYNRFYNEDYRLIYVGSPGPTDDFFQDQYRNHGRKIYSFIMQYSGLMALDKLFVLEVGCGAGGILKYFADQGCKVKGIDLGKEYLEYGRQRYNLDLEVATIESLALENKPDIIIYNHVLEHILSLKDQLGYIKKLMTPETILYIEVPGLKNLHQSYNNDLLLYLQNAHVYHFTKTTLLNLMESNSFHAITANEYVRSIFKLGVKDNIAWVNDYRSVIHYLKWMYRIRRYFPIPPYQLKFRIKRFVYNALSFFKIVPDLKKNEKWSS